MRAKTSKITVYTLFHTDGMSVTLLTKAGKSQKIHNKFYNLPGFNNRNEKLSVLQLADETDILAK